MQRKPDSVPVLHNGTGTPYLAVFNNLGEPIIDNLSGLPIGMLMTDFEYTYKEEKSDEGHFTIETDNPDLIAHPSLDFYMGLMLQWGWVFPEGGYYCSPVRKVVITEQKVDFTSSGVKIRITFSDSSVLLKNQPASYYNSAAGFEAYMKDILAGTLVGVELWDYSDTDGVQVTQKVVEETESEADVQQRYAPNQNYNPPMVSDYVNSLWGVTQEIPQKPSTIYPNCIGVKLWDLNEETKQWVFTNPDKFRVIKLMDKTKGSIVLSGVPKNKYQQLHSLVKTLNGGPYFVDSRDTKVFIHNAQTNRVVSKVYTYKGGNGELLEFQINASYAKTSVDASKKSDIDPDTGDLELNLTQATTPKGKPTEYGSPMYLLKDESAYLYNPNIMGSSLWLPLPERIQAGAPEGPYRNPYAIDRGWFARESASRPPEYFKQVYQENITKQAYPSLNAARTYLSQNVELTKEEVQKFWAQMKSQYNAFLSDTFFDPSKKMGEAVSIHHRVGNFVVKRKVYLQKDLEVGLFSNDQFGSEDFIKSVSSGEIELDNNLTKGLSQYSSNIKSDINKGIENLKQLPDFKVIDIKEGTKYMHHAPGRFIPDEEDPYDFQSVTYRSGVAYRTTMATIQYSVELEISIDGIKAITDYPAEVATEVMGNDIQDNQTQQIKAKTTIVGDPCLESSMNLQIQNVSAKFEGVWYIKEITHKFTSSGGYTCDIDFVQRNNAITRANLSSTIKSINYENIQKAAEVARETGSYKRQSQIQANITEKAVKDPNYGTYTVIGTGQSNKGNDEDYALLKGDTPVPYQKVTTMAGTQLEEGVSRENITVKIEDKNGK